MNCRNGRLLTTAELEDIALANGSTAEDLAKLHTAYHDANLVRSYLAQLTAPARLAMMWRGELRLDTSEATLHPEGIPQ